MNHFKNHILSLILAVLFLLGAGAISFYAIFKGTPAFAEAIINPRTAPEAVAAAEPADNPDDPGGTTENDNPETGKEKNDKTNNEGDKTEDNEGSGNDKDDTETERIRLKIVKVENKETLETKKKTENNKTPSFDIATQTEEFRAYVLSLLRTMKPFEFERLTTQLLRACGLEFYPGRRTGDDGVDGYGYITVAGLFKFKVLVQCKRYQESTKIANYAIRDLRGAVSTDAYKGLFVTTSSFSPRAKEEANKFPQIDLIDGRQFVDLMIEKKIGIVEENGTYSMKKDYLEHIQL